MTVDWQTFCLDQAVLREPSPDRNRLVLWVPAGEQDGCRLWQRVGVFSGDTKEENGLCFAPASSVLVREKRLGFLRRLFGRSKTDGGQTWLLPNGRNGEQVQERRSTSLLVWRPAPGQLDENLVISRWPGRSVRKLGDNLFLVHEAAPEEVDGEASLDATARQQAEAALAVARQEGDRRKELLALTDLGVALLSDKEAPQAITVLESALFLARQLGEPSAENDILGTLGLALLATRQCERAGEHLRQALRNAQASANPFEQKTALDNLATLHLARGEYQLGVESYSEALLLARQLGDKEHEASLLWAQAVGCAALKDVNRAIQLAGASIDLMKGQNPERSEKLASSLKEYRAGERSLQSTADTDHASAHAGSVEIGAHTTAASMQGARLLAMAFSAAKSFARFIGSGLKKADAGIRKRRQDICGGCAHHTGLRCKLCGCFTKLKAMMPHEKCPIGKWPQ